ncbi:hypothetical protein HXY32_00565 [Candidatus Bathyarchaeota archaeon]|nr:hypothetical protein [Candidatus Bathyarchaeota archaeon]
MKTTKPLVTIVILLIALLHLPNVLTWELERPGGTITINERTENATTDGKASVGIGVHIEKY